MKISVFLIISFIYFVFCYSDQNTTNDPYPVCPVKSFRPKRALAEYTRWRSNIESTPEFIVKILDEDMPIPKTKKVVAVNIQPIQGYTKGAEKIIVGGVEVSIPASKSAAPTLAETLKDYTRFVPPTTVATRVDGDFYHAPVQSISPPLKQNNFVQMFPRPRNPQRDESPPVRPIFLPRSPLPGVHQYAPITPVGFTRRPTDAPLTPPASSTDFYSFRKTNPQVHRTTPFRDIVFPTRTTHEKENFGFHPFEEDGDIHMTRTTFEQQYVPHNTYNDYKITSEKELVMPTTEKVDDHYDEGNKDDDKTADNTYGLRFYEYDDSESGKTAGKESVDTYEDKLKEQEEKRQKEIDNLDAIRDVVFRAQEEVTEKEDDLNAKQSDKLNFVTIDVTPGVTIMEKGTKMTMKETIIEKRRQTCSMIKLREINFHSPRTLPEIEAKLKQWAENSPVAKWVDITDGNFTTMERPIYMMIVDDPSSGQIISAKETVMIVAGMAGRDQHAVASAMYVLYQLIERRETHTDLLSKYRFWIIPVFNPDGYDYAMTFPHRREWAKNLRQSWDICKGRDACHSCEAFGLRCTIQHCYGVNLDRNFEYQWIPAEELRAEHPCGALYAGERQLSEVETRTFTKYLSNQERSLFIFIAFKEGEVLGVLYPHSHTRKKRPMETIYRKRAIRAAAAAYSIGGRAYVAGQTSEFLPLYAGGIEDWVDGHLGVDNTYTIMMFRPADTYNTKIVTERVVHEAYAAMDTLVLQTAEKPAGAIPPVTIHRARDGSATLCTPITFMLLGFLILVHTCLR